MEADERCLEFDISGGSRQKKMHLAVGATGIATPTGDGRLRAADRGESADQQCSAPNNKFSAIKLDGEVSV